jgi:hypothetical protein
MASYQLRYVHSPYNFDGPILIYVDMKDGDPSPSKRTPVLPLKVMSGMIGMRSPAVDASEDITLVSQYAMNKNTVSGTTRFTTSPHKAWGTLHADLTRINAPAARQPGPQPQPGPVHAPHTAVALEGCPHSLDYTTAPGTAKVSGAPFLHLKQSPPNDWMEFHIFAGSQAFGRLEEMESRRASYPTSSNDSSTMDCGLDDVRPPPGHRVSPGLVAYLSGTVCEHQSSWKRLRGKKGVNHLRCSLCGAKWKTRLVCRSG